MSITFTELPGWNFIVDEISSGVYKINGKDELGHRIELVGTDPKALFEECKKYAAKIIADSK